MKYVQYLNACIKTALEKTNDTIVLFGQNITAGSCLSGLTKGIGSDPKHLVLNTPNIENTQVGVGFGLMLNGVSSIFCMKQQDFLLLGIDHLVNTYNFVRLKKPNASFTIVTVVVDLGYQGIQSSLNNFGDFCSIARIPGYAVTNKQDADHIIKNHLVGPGFRIIGVSQRLFNSEILDTNGKIEAYGNGKIFQYYQGKDVTLVCFNFSYPQGLKLRSDLMEKGLQSSLFSVNDYLPDDWSCIIKDAQQTRKLVVIDDGKSVNRSCYHLTNEIYNKCNMENVLVLTRQCYDADLCPSSEEFIVNADEVLQELNQNN